MNRSQRLLIVAGTALVSCAIPGLLYAQPLPPPPPPGPAAPAQLPPGPVAGAAPLYDPQQLPAINGTVTRYTLTPRGDVDGLILSDGTEVHFPPHLSTQLVYAVRPGDAVTVRGLKALSIPLVAAVSITNNRSGDSVTDAGPGFGPGPKGPRQAGQSMTVQGRVQMALHGPRGDVNGALLEDGTILRLPPPEAERLGAFLAPGQTIAAQGDGIATPMGRVLDVQAIGFSPTQLSFIQRPPPPPDKRGPRP
ncbi:hypothetical protein BjapCC829_49230 (plasmid) [Bradyrhizobium barranii]|uniref:Secreted protein n=1 Tax=Bradyrhizobium barranii TaxID=2992140 RepID=A0ABY3R1Y6_9BRAD|nr:hypothetical protein [Bradyrhizobium japonicum]UFW91970.1 hypothetical protein BjapCC829_49230 [Bradyrhizobium japonicum]